MCLPSAGAQGWSRIKQVGTHLLGGCFTQQPLSSFLLGITPRPRHQPTAGRLQAEGCHNPFASR